MSPTFPGRVPVEFRGGLLPNDPDKPRLMLRPFLDARKVVPQHAQRADWLGAVGSWPMFGNDQYGDCVFAGQAHEIMALRAVAKLSPYAFTDDLVLGQYSLATGFRKDDPGTDQGADMQSALGVWRKRGFAGLDHNLRLFAEVDRHDTQQVAAAIDLFGSVSIGVRITQSAMDAFNAGEPWDIVDSSPLLGRHAIHGGWYDLALGKWAVVTWGQVQYVTQRWFDHYVDEVWGKLLDGDWAPGGKTPTGLDLFDLGDAFSALTGEQNPFPPAPQPPSPSEAPSAADKELWAGITHWLGEHHIGGNHDTQQRLLRWGAVKGLTR